MKRSWLIGLAAVIVVIGSAIANPFTSVAQSPSPSPNTSIGVPVAPIPVDPSLPNNRPPVPGASPSPKASPSPNASPTAIPNVSVPATGQPPLQPAPVASPLPINGTYKDPNGRFQVGILRNFSVSPLAGSVLIEARDGNLAYTVLALPQSQLGVSGGAIDNDALVKVAQTAFKQGEGFETGEARTIPGGLQIDWVGNLTIAGNTQNVGGVILARPLKDNVALVLIAATEAGGDQVLGAASALGNSLQAL
jgi:hypothetical protein